MFSLIGTYLRTFALVLCILFALGTIAAPVFATTPEKPVACCEKDPIPEAPPGEGECGDCGCLSCVSALSPTSAPQSAPPATCTILQGQERLIHPADYACTIEYPPEHA